MRNRRLVVGLAALACAVALPAAASAHNGQPQQGKHGKHHGRDFDRTVVRLVPVAGQTAKGAVKLKQRDGALSFALVVKHLTPGAFYAAHVHAGTCATPGAAALTLPDLYADEDGVATLVTTLPTAAGTSYVAGGFSVDVHAPPSASATPTISCGDIVAKPVKGQAKVWLKGTGVKGSALLKQKGGDVSVWISLRGLTPGAHALHVRAGSCAAPGILAVNLGDVTAGPDGKVSAKLTATSSALVVGKGFSLDVQAGASGTPESVVACGDQFATWKHGHDK
jgi:Cu/Zn superoxide dismutase